MGCLRERQNPATRLSDRPADPESSRPLGSRSHDPWFLGRWFEIIIFVRVLAPSGLSPSDNFFGYRGRSLQSERIGGRYKGNGTGLASRAEISDAKQISWLSAASSRFAWDSRPFRMQSTK